MSSAPLVKRLVMIAIAGTPRRSTAMASCRLHDEQLPQSPTPVITASQSDVCAINSGSAGAL